MVPPLDYEEGSIPSHRNFGTHLPVENLNILVFIVKVQCAISGSELKVIFHTVVFWDLSDNFFLLVINQLDEQNFVLQ